MTTIKFVNMTPHEVVINGVSIPPSGTVLRLTEEREVVDHIGNNPVYAYRYGEPFNVPPIIDGTYYIVSAMMLERLNRPDFIAPGPAMRDQNNRIIGCSGWQVKSGQMVPARYVAKMLKDYAKRLAQKFGVESVPLPNWYLEMSGADIDGADPNDLWGEVQ